MTKQSKDPGGYSLYIRRDCVQYKKSDDGLDLGVEPPGVKLYRVTPPHPAPGTKTVKLTLQSLIAIVESKEPEHRSFRCPSVAVVRQLTPRGSWQ